MADTYTIFNKKKNLIKQLKSCNLKKYQKSARTVLGFDRSNFHLSSFSGIVCALPLFLVHALPGCGVFSVVIKTVEIGGETGIVPPCSLATCGTVCTRVDVIVSIVGREHHSTVIRQRVASSSHKNKERNFQ